MMYKVKDHKNLVRDPSNKAILNVDRKTFVELRERKETKVTIQSLREEIDDIKNDFQEIKDLLRQIASKGS
jgi:hypothetical protein